MKNIILSFLVIILFAGLTYPQKMKEKMLQNRNKLEQLEKIKLIESLDMDEETSVRFFSRRNDFKKEMEIIENRNEEILSELEGTFSSKEKNIDVKRTQLLNELMENRRNIETKRQQFIVALKDIFTNEQTCKYVVFEKRFKDEIRNALMDIKRHQKN